MECPVHLDIMDDPVSLNCGHSFCHTCISNLVRDKAVKCPMCNTVQKLPNGLASLNINFGMRDTSEDSPSKTKQDDISHAYLNLPKS